MRSRALPEPSWLPASPPAGYAPARMRLRVVTYNARGFRDGLDRVADAITTLAPDVLLLQESGSRRGLRHLGAAAGMEVAGDPWSPFRRRVKNAILVRPPWRIVQHSLHR